MIRRTLAFLSIFVLAAATSVAMAGPAKPPKAAATASKPKVAKPPKAVKTTTVKTTTVKTTSVKAPKTKTVKASVKPAKTEKSKTVKTATTVEASTTPTAPTTPTTTSGDTVALTDVQQKLKRNTNLASKLQGRLPAGTDLMKAAYGFKNLGQFVAAVNTSYHDRIPFAQLKRKMVREGMSLGQAKQALRPASTTTTTGGQL